MDLSITLGKGGLACHGHTDDHIFWHSLVRLFVWRLLQFSSVCCARHTIYSATATVNRSGAYLWKQYSIPWGKCLLRVLHGKESK